MEVGPEAAGADTAGRTPCTAPPCEKHAGSRMREGSGGSPLRAARVLPPSACPTSRPLESFPLPPAPPPPQIDRGGTPAPQSTPRLDRGIGSLSHTPAACVSLAMS